VVSFSCPGLEDVCLDAVSLWNVALEGRTELRIGEGGYSVTEVRSNWYVCVNVPEGLWAGCTTKGHIDLYPGAWHGTDDPEAYRMGVLLHEMGHAIGLPDDSVDGPDGVMYPVMMKRTYVDSVTASQVP
jgi:hypothetical protein